MGIGWFRLAAVDVFLEQVLTKSSVYIGNGWFWFAVRCDATHVFLAWVLAKSSVCLGNGWF